MKKIPPTARRMMVSLVGIQLLFLVAGIFVILFVRRFAPVWAYSLGILSGTVFSLWEILHMYKGLQKAVHLPPDKAENYSKVRFIIRYLATALFLVAVFFLKNWVDPIGAVLGILSLQLAGYVAGFWEIRHQGDEKKIVSVQNGVTEENSSHSSKE